MSEAKKMNFFAKSDKGQIRKINQDSCGSYTASNQLGFFIVADGMGGHNAGEVASKIATDMFIEKAKDSNDIQTKENAEDFIKEIFKKANDVILYKAAADPSQNGMGTTAVAAIVLKEKIIIGNLGDSRAYIISNDNITQITEDHSYVEQLLKSGSIKAEEAKVHPKRNEITRALGIPFYIQPDIFDYDYKAGDILLLCSDGLDKMIEDSVILDIVKEENEAEIMCQKLIDAANSAGGLDNVTVLAVAF